MAQVLERDPGHQAASRDEPAVGVEEEALVDIDIEASRSLPTSKGWMPCDCDTQVLAVEVEMDDAFRAAELGHQHPALDAGAAGACAPSAVM